MYRKNNGQKGLLDFLTPFGELHPENRWVKMSKIIPWSEIEDEYAELFSDDNGAPAKPFRMALATLLIKEQIGASDEETRQMILENPYMQYFLGLPEFATEPPFATSMMVYWRKRITSEMLMRINEMIYRNQCATESDDKNGGSDDDGRKPPNKSDGAGEFPSAKVQNKGKLMLDATCVPSDIRYPTDTGLLNEAREKLEGMIDALHSKIDQAMKPRTYRRVARRSFLRLAKNRKPSRQLIRRTKKQQLSYVKRDLMHVERMLEVTGLEALSPKQQREFATIQRLFAQQKQMYDTKTNRCPDRIVSIAQDYVRAIARGKANAAFEFGAKISLSLMDGFTFLDRLSWDPYNEAADLQNAVEAYRRRTGCYPEAVLVDQIYRNRNNRDYCKERGIRISGPPLGRPSKKTREANRQQELQDQAERNAVEGKIGEGKTRHGLARIFTRLKETSETVIALAVVGMNLRFLLCLFLHRLFQAFDSYADTLFRVLYPIYSVVATF